MCLPLPPFQRDIESTLKRHVSDTLKSNCIKTPNNLLFFRLSECLSKGALRLLDESCHRKKSKTFTMDEEKGKENENKSENENAKKDRGEECDHAGKDVERSNNKEKIIESLTDIFIDLWDSCVGSAGTAYLALKYLKNIVEDDNVTTNDNDNSNSDKNNIINNHSNNNDSSSHDNNSKNSMINIKTIIYFLLSSINIISIEHHPRLFFIVSWLVERKHEVRYSDIQTKLIPKSSSVLNHFLTDIGNDNEKINDERKENILPKSETSPERENFVENKFISIVLLNLFESEMNLIFDIKSDIDMNAEALKTKGMILSQFLTKVIKCYYYYFYYYYYYILIIVIATLILLPLS